MFFKRGCHRLHVLQSCAQSSPANIASPPLQLSQCLIDNPYPDREPEMHSRVVHGTKNERCWMSWLPLWNVPVEVSSHQIHCIHCIGWTDGTECIWSFVHYIRSIQLWPNIHRVTIPTLYISTCIRCAFILLGQSARGKPGHWGIYFEEQKSTHHLHQPLLQQAQAFLNLSPGVRGCHGNA